MPAPDPDPGWWRNAVIYQVYPRSFMDSNGDGVGDLPGLISRLDHLRWLGVDAVWCTPITVSPNRDFGYDVADYMAVDPSLGTLSDLDRLVAEAGRRGIRVLLDIVPNHTSDRHPWFRDPARRRDYYVWADQPNNWAGAGGAPSWTRDGEDGRYYLHNYLPEQPDLNWWNPRVRAEFDRILGFWFERGVAGFRIDVAYGIVKDRRLRDNPPARPGDPPWVLSRGQRPRYSANRPEVHGVLRRWRRIADRYEPPRVLMGETFSADLRALAAYYGRGDELHLVQNFFFMLSPFTCEALRGAAEAWLAACPAWATPVWHASNHDFSRFPTRWCGGDDARVRLALTLLLTLPGACVLYQGDEIGMDDVAVPPERRTDRLGRDRARTPMPWTAGPGAGFTTGEPWLPIGGRPRSVAAQRRDPGSPLHLTRELIALRRRLGAGYRRLVAPDGCWRYRRGELTVTLDFERATATVEG